MGSPERNAASERSVWAAARKAGSQAPQNEKGQPLQAAPEIGGGLLLAGALRAPPKDLNP